MKANRNPSLRVLLWITLAIGAIPGESVNAQAGLRESLEKLDKNDNGFIDPDEVTPLARPFLERVLRNNRGFRESTNYNRPLPISQIQEEARYYFAVRNGQ
ncbi:MAG: calcium sensor EFh, partial [Planctomycetota bacterium]|nr:calcium sensor EFh [Planctomycetota bacterium]